MNISLGLWHFLQYPFPSLADDSKLHTILAFKKSVSLTELNIQRHALSTTLIRDLDVITDWGTRNLAKFNGLKKQSCYLSNKEHANPFPILMNGYAVNTKFSHRLIAVDISRDHIWNGFVVVLVVAAGKKLGFLFRAP